MDILIRHSRRLTRSVAVALSVVALVFGLSACASYYHSHVDSRGYATSAPTYYGYYGGYYPYRYGYGYGYGYGGYGYRTGYGCGGYYGGGCGGGYYGYY